MTLRAKLTATATLTVAVAMLIVSLGLYFLVQRAYTRDLQAVLRSESVRIARTLRRTDRLLHPAGTTVALLGAQGQLLRGKWPQSLPRLPKRHAGRLQIYRGGAQRGVLFRATGGGRWLALARSAKGTAVVLQRIAHYLVLLGAVAVVLAAAIAYLITAEVLSPLRRVVRTASGIARSGDVDRRLGRIGSGEMGELARAFDAMLDRLSHALRQQSQTAERERRFAAEAAHVLRNPLSTVLLNLEYLRRSLPEGTEQARAAADAHSEGRRLLHLTESLLRLARGESVPENAQPVDLGAVVREASHIAAQGRGRPPAQFDVAEGATVLGDRAALFGMVESVIDNAFKYSPAESTVQVRLVADRGLLRLTVEDRGEGIAEEHLPHVFDRFYRAAAAGDGSGLGLAIARAVALAHGGEIHVESERGRFTRVTIELPQAR